MRIVAARSAIASGRAAAHARRRAPSAPAEPRRPAGAGEKTIQDPPDGVADAQNRCLHPCEASAPPRGARARASRLIRYISCIYFISGGPGGQARISVGGATEIGRVPRPRLRYSRALSPEEIGRDLRPPRVLAPPPPRSFPAPSHGP